MEVYYVKQVASMVAKEKILIPRLKVKDDMDLEVLIFKCMQEHGMLERISPTEDFFKEVIEYIHLKAGYLHIKQLVPEQKKEDIQKSLLFWT